MLNRKTKTVCKTMKNNNRERCQHVSGLGALGERGQPQSDESELSHDFEDEFHEPEIHDNGFEHDFHEPDKGALYKVPGSLSPPGESDKGIEDKCRFR